ncbi:MAG: DUF4294 domain-containing protein [Chitinophagaceae bacterium]|jgi:hypothetical protein
MIKKGFILLFTICFLNQLKAQRSTYDTLKLPAWVSPEGDTLALSYLTPLDLLTIRHLTSEQKAQRAEWTRLRNAVYVTFPYAKAASKIMNEINAKLVGVTNRKERKIIIKSREKELRAEFTSKLTNLSVYQGKVLMKLINRETGNNCYEIIQEYKGGFTATVYQTVAFVFGTNLKQAYNPNDKDRDIETIVQELERMYGYRK